MKNFCIRLWVALCLAALCFSSCESFLEEGTITVSFNNNPASKAKIEVPDTENFTLSITDAKGKSIYCGRFADSPEKLSVPAGSYTVSAYSEEFEVPAFDSPQFGDTQVVVVTPNENVNVLLDCKQINAGLRLLIDESFKLTFPDATVSLGSKEGLLAFGYDERRTAFFKPGEVVVSVVEDEVFSQELFSRNLREGEILSVKLSSSQVPSPSGIIIQVDTARIYLEEEFRFGSDNAEDIDGTYDVLTAREKTGNKDVWVRGYIVGCASGSSSYQFEPPFTKDSNILIGLRSNSREKEYLLAVELRAGALREELNLMTNEKLLGMPVYIKGDLVAAYYGIPGLKNTTEYQF